MANIKISELNELETRHKEDLLTIVDTNNNETKKIKVETLAPENFELYAIADTQPTIPVGESYYNTKSNKIFTNIGGIYVDKGEPKKGILYIIFSDKATFAYNGTTLVSVGGASGSLVNVNNEYSTSSDDVYSCKYVNGDVLYYDTTGTTDSVQLSNSIDDYRYLEIFYISSGYQNSSKIDLSLDKTITLNRPFIYSGEYYDRMSKYNIAGSTITYIECLTINSNFQSVKAGNPEILIKKVVGYK